MAQNVPNLTKYQNGPNQKQIYILANYSVTQLYPSGSSPTHKCMLLCCHSNEIFIASSNAIGCHCQKIDEMCIKPVFHSHLSPGADDIFR